MILFLDSTNHYATAQIATKYSTANNVTVVAAAGRLGGAALFFDTSQTANVTRTVTPSAFGAGGNVFTIGFALRPITIPGTFTVFKLTLSAGLTITLQVTATGQLQVLRSGVVGAIVISPASTVRSAVGSYVEVQWNANNGAGAGSVIVRVGSSVVAQTFFPTVANTYTSFQFGPSGVEAGTFYLSDVYVLDGNATLPVGGVTRQDGTKTFLNDFLGNMSVQAMLATADGPNLSVGNTKWTPALAQPANFSQINARQANDTSGSLFNVGPTAGMRDTYVYRHPRAGTFQPDGTPWGYFANGTPWPLYGVQWMARVQANAAGVNIARVVRKIVTGTFAGDTLSQGVNVAAANAVVQFYLEALSGDPTNANAPWNFANVSLLPDPTTAGNLEFGVVKV